MYVSAWQGLRPSMLLPFRKGGAKPYPLDGTPRVGFHVARNAIYHIFHALGYAEGGTVLMPAYHSGNETAAVRAAGAKIRYYGINRRLEPDLAELERLCDEGAKALFVIHYIGWAQPMREIRALCERKGVLLIEDCALSFLSDLDGVPLGRFGAYSVFCLYKTLPVPSGGLLVQNGEPLAALQNLPLEFCGLAATGGRVAELGLEWFRTRADTLGRALMWCKRGVGNMLNAFSVKRVPVGDMGFELGNVNLGMGGLSRRLLERFDYASIKEARRQNFAHLRDRLAGCATLLDRDLEEGMCPLFFPILVADKHAAAEALKGAGVMATEFWNTGEAEATAAEFPDMQYLRDHLLEIPIHQDITPDHINYMAQVIERLQLRM